jgi:tRNA A-37 threonylcarbamoyl transferase component Bud32
MYGRLEDERSFNTVRRLVEYEDHMLRAARDAGLPTAQPYGVVEITPEREYLLVTEFIEGAVPLADVVDDGVIDDALAAVQRMWATGMAHRDIKPGNLLTRDGRVFLIDLAFAAIRPSPWRQAVDLANMMMTLALSSTPERVYERAVARFTPEEIAEAFAATRAATVPTQLRVLSNKDGRNIAAAFRALAPPRPPIAIQRWTLRRLGLTVSVILAIAVGFGLFLNYLTVAGLL